MKNKLSNHNDSQNSGNLLLNTGCPRCISSSLSIETEKIVEMRMRCLEMAERIVCVKGNADAVLSVAYKLYNFLGITIEKLK